MFGERLRMLRNEKGLTMQQMADKLGLTIGAWAKYERNEAEPTLTNLVQIADIFGVTTDFLLGKTNIRSYSPSNAAEVEKTLLPDIEKNIKIGDLSALYSFNANWEAVLEKYMDGIITEKQLQPLLQALTDLVVYYNDLLLLKEENKGIGKVLAYHEKSKSDITKLMNEILFSIYKFDEYK